MSSNVAQNRTGYCRTSLVSQLLQSCSVATMGNEKCYFVTQYKNYLANREIYGKGVPTQSQNARNVGICDGHLT